jgi:PTH1 family peptidyl-tRNA hydrolase
MTLNSILLVGLGNPTNKYDLTRHNVGFSLIDYLSRRFEFSAEKSKFDGLVIDKIINNSKIILLKPQTYMNNSGIPVAKFASFYKIPLSKIFVFHDDLDISFANVKVKIGGGSAGHNGLKSLDANVGNNYNRVRIGIGRNDTMREVSDYVLSKFTTTELEDLSILFAKIADNLDYLISNKTDIFLNNIKRS